MYLLFYRLRRLRTFIVQWYKNYAPDILCLVCLWVQGYNCLGTRHITKCFKEISLDLVLQCNLHKTNGRVICSFHLISNTTQKLVYIYIHIDLTQEANLLKLKFFNTNFLTCLPNFIINHRNHVLWNIKYFSRYAQTDFFSLFFKYKIKTLFQIDGLIHIYF